MHRLFRVAAGVAVASMFLAPARPSASVWTQASPTVLQLIVKDVTALTAKLKAAGVPIVSTGGVPVQVAPGLKIAIARDPNNMLLELVERAPR